MADLFKEKAQDWDGNDTIKLLSQAVGKAIIDNVSLNSEMNVMDFGAGTGLISYQVEPNVKKIDAVDVSQSMLDKLQEKISEDSKIKPICHDITKKPLNNKFDLIISAMALHHVDNIDNLFRSFAEHLEVGSNIALADLEAEDGSFHPEGTEGIFHHGFEKDYLEGLLKKNGFTNIKFITAHKVWKNEKEYPVFLLTAQKNKP